MRIVGLREARRALGALRDGISAASSETGDLTGGGAPVSLFGAPATLPLGPALLSIESGAPMWPSSAFGGPVAVATGTARTDLIAA